MGFMPSSTNCGSYTIANSLKKHWARRQDALSWELRAATSLARLWEQHSRADEADQLLASVYGRFNEGFETGDLKTARAMLDRLHTTPA
jgi:predicted ATPase